MKKIGQHIILILLLLTIPIVSSPDFDGTLSVFKVSPFQREFIRFVLVVVFFYINLNIFLPKLYSQKKYILFACCLLICFAAMVFIPNYLTAESNIPSQHFPMPMQPPPVNSHGTMPPPLMGERFPQEYFQRRNNAAYSQMIFSSLLPFLFSFLSSLFIFRNIEKKELERSKAKAELLSLKYQLQPHFLFNILNSIYSLTLLKSDDAPNSILKLSNVMRYVVRESSKDFVPLNREIEYLKDYIALQLVRTDNSLDFSYTENGDTQNLQIAPFILVNFIENAFKYGFNAEENSKIAVEIIVEGTILHYTVFNNIVNRNITDEESLKIGLKNTIEHLQQIYPGKHSLINHNNGTTFEVNLQINLS